MQKVSIKTAGTGSVPQQTVQIRPFEEGDAEFCFKVRSSAFVRAFYTEIGSDVAAAGIKAYMPVDYQRMAKQHPVFIVEIADAPAGFFVLRRESKTEAELYLIYVDLEHLRQGIGHACIEFMENWIQQNWAEVDTFFLDTIVPDYNGGFYEKAGFRAQEDLFCTFRGVQVKALRMSKPLDGFNVYADDARAAAYATLAFPGTYYLAFRDVPAIIARHVQEGNVTAAGENTDIGGNTDIGENTAISENPDLDEKILGTGKTAMDFGCGAGRSTRFLMKLGFQAVGVDISENMIKNARQLDPEGDYRLVPDGLLNPLADESFDLVLSAFTFDNIPTLKKKVNLFTEIRRVLRPGGVMINLVSTPQLYLNDWASFTTTVFDENKTARCGDIVKTLMKDVEDQRPVDDILWPDEDYKKVYRVADFHLLESVKPLATGEEPIEWINETTIAPWIIYILKRLG